MKKILIFYNFKGSAELEWLMPILKIYKKINKFSQFLDNKNAYEYLKKNERVLQNEWRKISRVYILKIKLTILFLISYFLYSKIFLIIDILFIYWEKNL